MCHFGLFHHRFRFCAPRWYRLFQVCCKRVAFWVCMCWKQSRFDFELSKNVFVCCRKHFVVRNGLLITFNILIFKCVTTLSFKNIACRITLWSIVRTYQNFKQFSIQITETNSNSRFRNFNICDSTFTHNWSHNSYKRFKFYCH